MQTKTFNTHTTRRPPSRYTLAESDPRTCSDEAVLGKHPVTQLGNCTSLPQLKQIFSAWSARSIGFHEQRRKESCGAESFATSDKKFVEAETKIPSEPTVIQFQFT